MPFLYTQEWVHLSHLNDLDMLRNWVYDSKNIDASIQSRCQRFLTESIENTSGKHIQCIIWCTGSENRLPLKSNNNIQVYNDPTVSK